MRKIFFTCEAFYVNYTNRLKITSLKDFIDLELNKYGFEFLIVTNRPQDFDSYACEYIHVLDIEEIYEKYPFTYEYERIPDDPTDIYSTYPFNNRRHSMRRAVELGAEVIIALDDDVYINRNHHDGQTLRNYLDIIYEPNTIMTGGGIFLYEDGIEKDVFRFHKKYIEHFNLNFDNSKYTGYDGPCVLYNGANPNELLNFLDYWDKYTEFGYKKEFGFGYENWSISNNSLIVPQTNFTLKSISLPFISHHTTEDRNPKVTKHVQMVESKKEKEKNFTNLQKIKNELLNLIENFFNSNFNTKKIPESINYNLLNDNTIEQDETLGVSISGINLAEKGFYINLDSSLDRKQSVEEQIEKYKIKGLERFSALSDPYKFKSCTKSHLSIFKNCIENNYESIFILEDDFEIKDKCYINDFEFNFLETLGELAQDLKNVDWDVVLLGCNPKTYLIPETKLLSRNYFSTGSWAYIIKKDAYSFIYNNCDYERDFLAIDDWLALLSKKGFKVFATTPKLISHKDGMKSTLQNGDLCYYNGWIEGNYENYLYRYVENLNFPDKYDLERNMEIVIVGHFVENFLFYLRYLLFSLPEELKKCKFTIIYDTNNNSVSIEQIRELQYYFQNRHQPINYEIKYSSWGLIDSMKVMLDSVKSKYLLFLEHDWIFMPNHGINFKSIYDCFEKYNFVNSVWFNKDWNHLKGYEIEWDKNGIQTPFEREERIQEIPLVTSIRWSNNPAIHRTSKLKEWFKKYIENPYIGINHQGPHNIEETISRFYREEINNSIWDELKDSWGTFIFGDLNHPPCVAHTDASKRYQEDHKSIAEENAIEYMDKNPLPEID